MLFETVQPYLQLVITSNQVAELVFALIVRNYRDWCFAGRRRRQAQTRARQPFINGADTHRSLQHTGLSVASVEPSLFPISYRQEGIRIPPVALLAISLVNTHGALARSAALRKLSNSCRKNSDWARASYAYQFETEASTARFAAASAVQVSQVVHSNQTYARRKTS